MNARSTVVITLSVMLMAACGGGEGEVTKADDASDRIASEIAESTGMEPANDTTPCEILDDQLIRSHFEIPPDTEIARKPSKYSPHPLCTVSWRKANADEILEQNRARTMDYIQRKARGEDVKIPIARTEDEVTLTLVDADFDDAAAARTAFDSSMKMLSDGITRSHEGVELTVQSDLTPINGVGDKAMWSAKMHQMSVVEGTTIFHVTVNTGNLDADLATAKAIAAEVATEI